MRHLLRSVDDADLLDHRTVFFLYGTVFAVRNLNEFVNNFHTFGDLTESGVASIQVRTVLMADEEL